MIAEAEADCTLPRVRRTYLYPYSLYVTEMENILIRLITAMVDEGSHCYRDRVS